MKKERENLMGKWKEVSRCKKCGKVYPAGVCEICRKCGCVIAREDSLSSFFGNAKCMIITENCERIVARKHWFKWILKESEGKADE